MHRRSLPLAAALTFVSAPCLAQSQDHSIQRFDPAPAGDRLFGVQTPSTQGHLQVHGGLVFDYAYNPLTLTHRRGRDARRPVVSDQAFAYANVAFALWDHLTVGAVMPMALYQTGQLVTGREGELLEAPRGVAAGDLRLSAKGSFFGGLHDAFQVGLAGYLWLPTGRRDAFIGDGHARGSIEALLGGEVARFYWNVAAGPQLRAPETIDGTTVGSSLAFSGGLGVLLGDDKQVQLGPETRVSIKPDDIRRRNTNGELLLGAKYRFAEDFVIGAAAGPGFAEGFGTPDVRFVASMMYSPDPHAVVDADGDHVPDHEDACPDQIGVAHADPDTNGCPPAPPPPDEDVDGVPDAVDACPGVAGVASEDRARNGCPADGDGDGVPDGEDACPDAAATADDADPDRPGCARAPDADGDGVPDDEDACPDIAGVEGAEEAGCPGDRDGDGIRDDRDACPDVRGPDHDDPEQRGCLTSVRLEGTEIVILQQVQFAQGRVAIADESDELLNQVASVLETHPEILKLEIQGHTDDRGGAALNRRLSQRRAEAVLEALVERNIARERLIAKGYGPDEPIASNDTDEGRARNRRVQFKITELAERTDVTPTPSSP